MCFLVAMEDHSHGGLSPFRVVKTLSPCLTPFFHLFSTHTAAMAVVGEFGGNGEEDGDIMPSKSKLLETGF